MAMTGTQIFITALVVIVAVLVVMLAALKLKTPATAELSIQKGLSLKVSVSPADKDRATEATVEAAKARGQSSDAAANIVRSKLSEVRQVHLKRVLWVDDHPDNNVYESLALMRLGFLITTATSNDAACRYLAEADFDAIITDFGGSGIVGVAQRASPPIPLVVYTVRADERREELVAAGALAVEDEPGALIVAMLAISSPR
jgi:PleD family two-component response regulator